MSKDFSSWAELIAKLLNASSHERIQWEKGPQQDQYIIPYSDSAICISQLSTMGSKIHTLQILDENGHPAATIDSDQIGEIVYRPRTIRGHSVERSVLVKQMLAELWSYANDSVKGTSALIKKMTDRIP
jgi:hypothetical protein